MIRESSAQSQIPKKKKLLFSGAHAFKIGWLFIFVEESQTMTLSMSKF